MNDGVRWNVDRSRTGNGLTTGYVSDRTGHGAGPSPSSTVWATALQRLL